MKNKVLIIIPAYNEEENIENVVDSLIKDYAMYDYVVINDGSTDSTIEKCENNNYNVINLATNVGLAGAFQTGMKYASIKDYDFAIQFDGDGQHNAEYIDDMINCAIDNRYDIVIGSRFVNKKKRISLRTIGSCLLTCVIWITTKKTIKDPTSGMRLYDKRVIDEFAIRINYGPEPDTIAFLFRKGITCGEIPEE